MVSTAEAGCLLVLTLSREGFVLDRVTQMAHFEPINAHCLPGILLTADSEQQPVVPVFPLSRKLTSQDSWRWLCQAHGPESSSRWRTMYGVPALLALAHVRYSWSSCVTEDAST